MFFSSLLLSNLLKECWEPRKAGPRPGRSGKGIQPFHENRTFDWQHIPFLGWSVKGFCYRLIKNKQEHQEGLSNHENIFKGGKHPPHLLQNIAFPTYGNPPHTSCSACKAQGMLSLAHFPLWFSQHSEGPYLVTFTKAVSTGAVAWTRLLVCVASRPFTLTLCAPISVGIIHNSLMQLRPHR